MKIATWNINSLKQRLPNILCWLQHNPVEVLLLQELKGLEFPEEDFKTAGYHATFVNQKAYNGVAVLSKEKTALQLQKLPGMEEDEQARFLQSEYKGLTILNIYLPNGNPVNSEKYPYKLRWMDCLYTHIKALKEKEIPFIVAGDFNVIPEDIDCLSPQQWTEDALALPQTRAAFRRILHLGLTDAFRIHEKRGSHFTFWDYQGGAWDRNNGIRIDHFLLSPAVADKMIRCNIDTTPRGEEHPSDHTPLIVEIDWK